MVKIFKTFGKTIDVTSPIWRDAWLYVTAALDGTWGYEIFNTSFKLYSTGAENHWVSDVFTATTTSISVTVPIASKGSYVVYVEDISANTLVRHIMLTGLNDITFDLTIGHMYYIHSANFE